MTVRYDIWKSAVENRLREYLNEETARALWEAGKTPDEAEAILADQMAEPTDTDGDCDRPQMRCETGELDGAASMGGDGDGEQDHG